MRIQEVKIYRFDELSDGAKEKARDWWREGLGCDEWWDSVYEDAERVHLKITGFDLDRHEITGRFTADAEQVADEILKDCGEACETYKTASTFLQERNNLVDCWGRDADGEFNDEAGLDNALDDLEKEFQQSLLEDYRLTLGKEWEYINSEEQVDEAIKCNEYEFYENGERTK